MTKQEELENLKMRILKQKICPELAAQATQLVFGDGSADAELVFIGEAPGKNEDLQGLPFVGAAGKFLNEMLAGIGLARKDVYITNIVKYRPPANRDPLPEEKAAFLPFLKKQLMIIQPKLIVTLGRHSMEAMLPGLKISQCHGQPKRIKLRSKATDQTGNPDADAMQGTAENRTEPYQKYGEGESEAVTQQGAASWIILPLFHPAAALYNGGMRQTLVDDFNKIPKVLANI